MVTEKYSSLEVANTLVKNRERRGGGGGTEPGPHLHTYSGPHLHTYYTDATCDMKETAREVASQLHSQDNSFSRKKGLPWVGFEHTKL